MNFIDELVQIANLPHGGFLDRFHPDAAYHAFNQLPRGIEAGSFGNEGFVNMVTLEPI